MKLTPLDIKKQEFKKNLRGYDPVEVDAFLEMVADEFESTLREKNQLADEVLRLRTQLQDYLQVEKTLKETLVNAQENVAVSKQTSQREADLILREAELKAEKIIENARMKLERLKNDILVIKAQKESFARRLRHLLESQIELINVLELDDLGFEDETKKPGASDDGVKKQNEGAAAGENSLHGRKKIEIPKLQRNQPAPLIRNAADSRAGDRQEAEEGKKAPGAREGKKPDDLKKTVPRITDEYIT